MSIATHAIRYGWVYLASLTLGTGTIFMVDPVLMNRITLKDRIEVTMAVVERCYATQTGTNADGTPVYAVAPPVEVRTWYDDNGAPVTVTNSIDWRDDRSMKVDLDAKIRALCPYYVNTNSVYDGTTNIVMNTFTGLLTSLDLGDHTNFTSIPAIGTNAAVYGPWAWRNYSVAWQERYKVLNALKMRKLGHYAGTSFPEIVRTANIQATQTSGWHVWYGFADLGLADGTVKNVEIDTRVVHYFYTRIDFGAQDPPGYPYLNDDFKITASSDIGYHGGEITAGLYLTGDSSGRIKIWNCLIDIQDYVSSPSVSYDALSAEVSCDLVGDQAGFSLAIFSVLSTIDFPFQYCTNKYW